MKIQFLFLLLLCTVYAENSFAKEEKLMGFISHRDITPTYAVPLAGYGGGRRRLIPFDFGLYPYASFLRPSEGILDPIRSKVLVLKKGESKLIWIGLDLIGIPIEFHEKIFNLISKYGFKRKEIIISATHTHSGPGGLIKGSFWNPIATDRFVPEVYEQLINNIVTNIEETLDQVQEIELEFFPMKLTNIQRNRRDSLNKVDNHSHVLLIKQANAKKTNYFGAIINFSLHGTSLGTDNLHMSADSPGAIERATEQWLEENSRSKKATVMFINAAEGDVSPAGSGVDGMNTLGERYVEQFAKNFQNRKMIQTDFSIKTRTVNLGKAKLHVSKCVNPDQISWINKINWLQLSIPKKWVARTVEIWQIKLGNMLMFSWPGEATTSLGFAIRDFALSEGFKEAWILGLTNGHRAYFTSPTEYEIGGYEACASLYGKNGGIKIVNSHINGIKEWK
jgi:neutral ceramidase